MGPPGKSGEDVSIHDHKPWFSLAVFYNVLDYSIMENMQNNLMTHTKMDILSVYLACNFEEIKFMPFKT